MIRTIAILLRQGYYVAVFFTPRSATERYGYIYEKEMVDLAVGFRLCYDRAAWMCGRFCP